MTDIRVVYDSGIALLIPVSITGKAWITENTQAEPWQWQGESLAVERRSVEAIVDGAKDAGLEVETTVAHDPASI
ncbi:MAG: hypothetical protein ROO76_22545 [Terriglobia bacterium]|nr:hypothetical protein [Terriglobia bacterium]